MGPQSKSAALDLRLLPGAFAVEQVKLGEPMPDAMLAQLNKNDGRFLSITKTDEEISVVADATGTPREGRAEWRCIKVT
jgi:hypothetical protein